jgi:hypothetical protein
MDSAAAQPLVERLKRDDVLAIGEHHAADRNLVHVADGFTDRRRLFNGYSTTSAQRI